MHYDSNVMANFYEVQMIKPSTYRFPVIVKCRTCEKSICGFIEVDDSAVIWGTDNFYLFEAGKIICIECEQSID